MSTTATEANARRPFRRPRTRATLALLAGVVAAAVAGVAGGTTAAQFTAVSSNSGNTFTAAASFGGGGSSCPSSTYLAADPIAGFETGSVGTGSTGGYVSSVIGAVTVDPAVKRTGSYSAKVAKTLSGAGQITYLGFGFLSNHWNTASARFSLHLDSLPASDVTSFMWFNQSGSTLNVGYQASTKQLKFYWFGQTPLYYGPVSAGTWYDIDVKQNIATNPRTASWSVNGVDQGTVSSAETATNSGAVYFGGAGGDEFTAHYDDIALTRSTSQYPIGNLKVHGLRPNATPAWSFSNGAFANNDGSSININTHTRLDEVPMSSSADYVAQLNADSTGHVELAFEDTAETCIRAVRGVVAMHKAASQSMNQQAYIYESGTAKPLFNGDHGQTGLALKTNPIAPNGAPTTGWTTATLNGLTARIGYSSDANPNPYWDALMLEYAVS